MEELLSPIDQQQVEQWQLLGKYHLGGSVTFYQNSNDIIENFQLAIIGVKDGRGSIDNYACAKSPDVVRAELYKLTNHFPKLKIVDLGNIEAGETHRDTHFALSTIVYQCLQAKVLPVIIGGSHDLTCAQYLAYENLDKQINVVVVDEKINWKETDEVLNDDNFLMSMLTHQPNYLFNFTILAYQSYFLEEKSIDTLNKLNFEAYRLGELRNNFEECEPIVRDADMLSFDMSALKAAEFPGNASLSPNGLYAEEACAITRYAGLSDRLSSVGFYGANPDFDKNNLGSQLVAQMIWYFFEGYYNRKDDFPHKNETDENNYFKYIVNLSDTNQDLTFWKSKKTARWWVQVPDLTDDASTRNYLVPCSYADYQKACNDEIPDKWLKAFERIN